MNLMHVEKKAFTYDRADNLWRNREDNNLVAFYDRYTRNWIAMWFDMEDHQVGNAGIGYTFSDAFGYLEANNRKHTV